MSLSFPVMNGTILRRIGVKNDASTPARNIPRSIPFADEVRNDTAIIAAMQISKILSLLSNFVLSYLSESSPARAENRNTGIMKRPDARYTRV